MLPVHCPSPFCQLSYCLPNIVSTLHAYCTFAAEAFNHSPVELNLCVKTKKKKKRKAGNSKDIFSAVRLIPRLPVYSSSNFFLSVTPTCLSSALQRKPVCWKFVLFITLVVRKFVQYSFPFSSDCASVWKPLSLTFCESFPSHLHGVIINTSN